MALCTFEHFKLVSKISLKVFELGTRKLSQQKGDDKYLIKFQTKSVKYFQLWSFAKLDILNLSARYLENYLSQGLETWSADR